MGKEHGIGIWEVQELALTHYFWYHFLVYKHVFMCLLEFFIMWFRGLSYAFGPQALVEFHSMGSWTCPACTSFLTKRDTSKSQETQAMLEVHHPAWDLLREDLVPTCPMDPIFLYKEKEDSAMGYCPTVEVGQSGSSWQLNLKPLLSPPRFLTGDREMSPGLLWGWSSSEMKDEVSRKQTQAAFLQWNLKSKAWCKGEEKQDVPPFTDVFWYLLW